MSHHLRLGTMVSIEDALTGGFTRVRELGLDSCQLVCWQPQLFSDELAARIRAEADLSKVEISSLWAGHSGVTHWNFQEGPMTIGLVPEATRAQRLGEYQRALRFAAALGAPSVTTHAGFIPENPMDPLYARVLEALASLCRDAAGQGLQLWLETGQETPVTLLRTLHDIGGNHLGINFDPANLLLYGKGNPQDAIELLGPWVRGVHAKDGRYPTQGSALGEETAIGKGLVDFPRLLHRLKQLGYSGRVTIEREIHGPQQRADILSAIDYLRPLL